MIYYSKTFTAFDRNYSTQILYCYLVNLAVIKSEGVKDDFTSSIDKGALFRLNGSFVQTKFPSVEKILKETGLTRNVYFRAKKNLEKIGVIGKNKIQVIDGLFPDPTRSKKHIHYFELVRVEFQSRKGKKHLSGKDLIVYSLICHRAILDGYTSIISYDNYLCNQLYAEWKIDGDYKNPDRVAVYNAIGNLKRMGLISRISGKETVDKKRCYYLTINNSVSLSEQTDTPLMGRYELSEDYKFNQWKNQLKKEWRISECVDNRGEKISVSEVQKFTLYLAVFKNSAYGWFMWTDGMPKYERAQRSENGKFLYPSFYMAMKNSPIPRYETHCPTNNI